MKFKLASGNLPFGELVSACKSATAPDAETPGDRTAGFSMGRGARPRTCLVSDAADTEGEALTVPDTHASGLGVAETSVSVVSDSSASSSLRNYHLLTVSIESKTTHSFWKSQ